MKRATITRLIALSAVLAPIAGVAAAAPSHIAVRASRSADQVRTAERSLLRATVDADTQAAGSLLAPDLQEIGVTGSVETRAQSLANIGGQIDFVTLKSVSPIRVRVYGNTAAARFEAAFKVVAHGTTVKHRGWITDLFERREGRWQVVWSQTTATPNDLALFIQSLQPPARQH